VIREAARSFFILRSNKWKESDESQTGNLWKDVVGLGGRYNFGPTVPNQRKLREAEPGAELLFDRKEPRGVEFFAVASLKKVTENGHFSAWLLESGFQFYSPSIPVTDETTFDTPYDTTGIRVVTPAYRRMAQTSTVNILERRGRVVDLVEQIIQLAKSIALGSSKITRPSEE